ncbi:hypothetical protein A6R68_12043 [Neotoma lepida]|uniref:Uncharacterized protein n=1 Tax=Neotoma lepida TaxID=56216 RepID=A0A1A6H4W5_NEOLE|nr:hypothetical protein A6R68_12043 [Neotoma lepida]
MEHEAHLRRVCVFPGPSGGVLQYIQEMREVLYNLQNRMQKAKQNIEGISQAMQGVQRKTGKETRRLMSKRTRRRSQTKCIVSKRAGLVVSHQEWSANPLFERKDNKKEALLDLDGRVANLNKRYAAVKDAGVRIQAMVAVTRAPPTPVLQSIQTGDIFTLGQQGQAAAC